MCLLSFKYHNYDNYYHNGDNYMSFLGILKKNKDIRRLFGERELKIIEKQLLGVRLKASEKTRLSRDIRKKFDAIEALVPFTKNFQLKHGELIKNMIDESKDIIVKSRYFPKIRKIVLFGSVIQKKLTSFSDIDIAVEFIDINKEESMRFRLDIMKKVDERIEIHVYNSMPNKIKKEIDNKGRIIYERKNQG